MVAWWQKLGRPVSTCAVTVATRLPPRLGVQILEGGLVERGCAMHEHVAAAIPLEHLLGGAPGGLIIRQVDLDVAGPVVQHDGAVPSFPQRADDR
jgi:hypothetical protein